MREQKTFQIVMCVIRILIISIIIICCLDMWINKVSVNNEIYKAPEPEFFNFKNSGIVLSVIVFSLMYQLLLPGVVHLLEKKEENAWRIIFMVTVSIFILYGALGFVAPFAINDLKAQLTLNFRKYSRGSEEQAFWALMISYSVILLPAIDVMSCFPFLTIGLADNWRHMIYGKVHLPHYKTLILRMIFTLIPLIIAALFFNIV
jgi:hypothetical protein